MVLFYESEDLNVHNDCFSPTNTNKSWTKWALTWEKYLDVFTNRFKLEHKTNLEEIMLYITTSDSCDGAAF